MLTYTDLAALVADGMVSIEGAAVPTDQINGASIDLTLGPRMLFEDEVTRFIDLAARESLPMREKPLHEDGSWHLWPGDFFLAHTREYFRMPADVAGHYMLKSTLARNGLQHLMAGFADPTWEGVLTLELVNQSNSVLMLRPGMKIGQMLFFRGSSPVPDAHAYAARGQYQGDSTVTASRGVR